MEKIIYTEEFFKNEITGKSPYKPDKDVEVTKVEEI